MMVTQHSRMIPGLKQWAGNNRFRVIRLNRAAQQSAVLAGFYVEARITSTGFSECRTIVSVTLPSTQRLTPERP
jgi:hypothetical protein